MCLSNTGWESITEVSENPTTYLLKLNEGTMASLKQRAALFADMVKELRTDNPGHNFQLIPFSSDDLGHLESMLAIADKRSY